MPTQTSTSAPIYCQRKSGSPFSNALSRTFTTGFTKPKMAMRLTGLFFMSKAQMTYPAPQIKAR